MGDAEAAVAAPTYIIIDTDNKPVKCDMNSAHFEGAIYEASEWVRRTGHFAALVEQGVVSLGNGRFVADSFNNIPFVLGTIQGAKVHDFYDPCPPTAIRVSNHDSEVATDTPGVSARGDDLTQLPDGIKDFSVNKYTVREHDLEFGRVLAAIWDNSEFANRILNECDQSGRAFSAKILELGRKATAPAKAIVLRRFTSYAESKVATDLTYALFEQWYKELHSRHRRLPRSQRKSEDDINLYISTMMHGQPSWRKEYGIEIKTLGHPPSLEDNLRVIRALLLEAETYAELDSLGSPGAVQAGLAFTKLNTNSATVPKLESDPIKRAFALSLASGDSKAAFAIASQAGKTAAGVKVDASKSTARVPPIGGGTGGTGGAGGGSGGGDGHEWVPLPRDKTGRITHYVPGARPCKCGGPHLNRDCDAKDAEGKRPWAKDSNGKWGWIGGHGWVDGKPPAKKTQSACAVSIASDSDVQAQLKAFFSDDAAPATVSHEFSPSLVVAGAPQPKPASQLSRPAPSPSPTASIPTDSSQALPAEGNTPVAPLGRIELFLRSNQATIGASFILLLTLAVAALGVVVALRGTFGPALPDNFALVSYSPGPRATSTSFATLALKIIACLAFSSAVFYPSRFYLICLQIPIDVLTTIAFIAVSPLGLLPTAFSLVVWTGLTRRASDAVNRLRGLKLLAPPLAGIATIALLFSGLFIGPPSAGPWGQAVRFNPNATTQFESATGLHCVDLPYSGKWVPVELEKGGGVVYSADIEKAVAAQSACPVDSGSLLSKGKSNDSSKSTPLLPLLVATIDSGATASCTDDCSRLVNVTSTDEVFGAANGHLTSATAIGDLPVVAKTKSGLVIKFSITNVRCVPEFKNYTLISVDQIWEEQGIESSFCKVKQLKLPEKSGGHVIPFDVSVGRNAVRFASGALLDCADKPRPSRIHAANAALGFHAVGSTAHVGRLSHAQAGQLMERRLHCPVKKIRELPSTCKDAPPNLAGAAAVACPHCAAANITRPSHGGTLTTSKPSSLPPCLAPGTLHIDLKGPLRRSVDGFFYAMFFVDEYSRFIFVEYLKTKTQEEQIAATTRVLARFNSKVGVPTTDDGKPLPKPSVTLVRHDHEAALESRAFELFRGEHGISSEMSPPHDHDLNLIAERAIRTISDKSNATALFSGAQTTMWPWIFENSVNIHNCLTSSTGNSLSDASISCWQRLTLTQPRIMDLCSFGSQAVVLKPQEHIIKSDVGAGASRGWEGHFLGRTRGTFGTQWDVLAAGRIVHSSAVQVNEEHFGWHGQTARQPLHPSAFSRAGPENNSAAGRATASISSTSDRDNLCFLNLFSGPYARAHGLSETLKMFGWKTVIEVDNDPDTGGGWAHDLFNDEKFTSLLADASAGRFDAIMIAFPCSAFSAARFFPCDPPGPPPIHTHAYPDGLPQDQIPEGHREELRKTHILLDRTLQIAIAAHSSPKRTTIVLENPADRSPDGVSHVQATDQVKNHGSIFATSFFKQLKASIPLSSTCTFAYCRFDEERAQKYTTLFYSNDAATVLDQLSGPAYQCNHPPRTHKKVAGGRRLNGTWASTEEAAYPAQLCARLAMAFTAARTGDPRPIAGQRLNLPAPVAPPSSHVPRAISAPPPAAGAPPIEGSSLRPLAQPFIPFPSKAAQPSVSSSVRSPSPAFPSLDSPAKHLPIQGKAERAFRGRPPAARAR